MNKKQSEKHFVILFIITFLLLSTISFASYRLYKLHQLNNQLSTSGFLSNQKIIKHNDIPVKNPLDINLKDYKAETGLEDLEITPKRPLRIGYFTDSQCWKKNNVTYIKRCKIPLEKFMSEMEIYQPDIIIEGGDLIDGYDDIEVENFIELDNLITKGLNKKLFHVLGNHETNSFPKEKWLEMTQYKHTYYYFDIGKHRFIVLDTNNRKVGDGNSFDATAKKRDYPGYIDEEQFRWLRKLLKNSKDYEIIAFTHAPILEKTDTKKKGFLLLNGERIRKIFSKYNVRSVFSGHVEDLCKERVENVDYYILKGFYKENKKLGKKYKDGGFFYELTFNKDNQLDIKTFYRKDKKSKFETLELEGAQFDCNGRDL